jgi:hypothetical protein
LGYLGYMLVSMVTAFVTTATANQITVTMVPRCQTDNYPKLSTSQIFYPYSICRIIRYRTGGETGANKAAHGMTKHARKQLPTTGDGTVISFSDNHILDR